MLLVGGAADAPLRVALVTTHLRAEGRRRPRSRARRSTRRSRSSPPSSRAKFGIAAPRIAVCGLNPHAGEGGHLGREEIDVIAPAIAAARARGPRRRPARCRPTRCSCRTSRSRYDAIVAMYHDQGLPVLKAASFGHGVNVTLGLPFIRTSVDHGTALDLAADAAKARDRRSRQPVRRGRSRDRARRRARRA